MAYTKQTFTSGQTLKASDLNTMSQGIVDKQDKLVSGTNLKTINGVSLLGGGDIAVEGGSSNLFYGKKVLCLGDSITYGQGLSPITKRWANVLASNFGWDLTVEAEGGISLASHYYTSNSMADKSICKRVDVIKNMSVKPDVVIVWGGHNDNSYRASPLGKWEDDTNSLKGALRYIASVVHEYAPKATLFVLTPLWMNLDPYVLKVPSGTTDTDWDFFDAIYSGAYRFGWIPIDMRLCGITPFTHSAYTSDNVHPNEQGTKLIVNYLSEELQKHYLFKSLSSVAVTSIALNKNTSAITVGGSEQLSVSVMPSDATNKAVNWKSSNTSVATVSNGLVTGVGSGNAVITATTVDGGYSASCTFAVSVQAVSVTGVSLDKTSHTLNQGESFTLSAIISPSNATNQNVQWSSSNEDVATVTDGFVKALREGDCVISATTVDGGFSAECSLTVLDVPDYYVFEKYSGITHDGWINDSYLGMQYFLFDGLWINKLKGKTVTNVFAYTQKTSYVSGNAFTLYKVPLTNPTPPNWISVQECKMSTTKGTANTIELTDPLVIEEGYTLGIKANRVGLLGYTSGSVFGDKKMVISYYENASATTTKSLDGAAVDFKVY